MVGHPEVTRLHVKIGVLSGLPVIQEEFKDRAILDLVLHGSASEGCSKHQRTEGAKRSPGPTHGCCALSSLNNRPSVPAFRVLSGLPVIRVPNVSECDLAQLGGSFEESIF